MTLVDDIQWLIDAADSGDTGEFTRGNLIHIWKAASLLLVRVNRLCVVAIEAEEWRSSNDVSDELHDALDALHADDTVPM